MKKYLLTLITLTFFLCEASFSKKGGAFATPASLGNGVTWEISGTTLTIGYEGEGSGVMPDYANIADRPWNDAKGDITSIVVENGVTSIGKYAFKDFTAITSLNSLPNSLTSMGYQAFYGCTSLASVTIPQNVTKVGDGLFGGCSSLTMVVWNATNCAKCLASSSEYTLSATWNPFYGTPPRSTITSFTFGSNVEVIPAGLCSSMTNITSITIPSSVATIGNDAFKGCSKITTITIPSSVNSIGTSAFQNCSALANITIPQGVTTIGNNTFDGCATLKAITIPSSVTSIGNYAFRNCSTMVRVNFPSALTSIGTSAFENTPKLKSIPLASATSLTSIEASAFALSSADETATGLLVIPSGVTSIGGNAFKNRSGITGVVICNTSSTWTNCLASTTFTGTPTDIPVYVNSTCKTHYQSATGWDHFTSAGYTTSYTISSMDCGTTASKLYASLNLCTGELTFTGSKCNMKNFNTSSNKAPWAAYKEAIKSVTFNSYVQTVGEYAFYECGALATVNTGSATNLTSIGQRAFQYCRALTSITIPASVTSMSAYSFYDTGLTSVTWNAKNCPSITSAGTSATPFANINFVDYNKHPEKLTSFTFGSEVEVIPAYLCYGLTGITSITIPSKVTTIGGSAFATCSALASVTIPTSVTTINSGAFGTCNALTSVKYVGTADQWCGITFGNSTSNPTYFSHSLKLNNSDDVATSVSISASTIGKYAFERNTELTSVTLSSAVDNFQTSAFDDCTGLTSLRFDGTLAQWCDNTFANNEANPLYYAHHFYLNSGTELTNLEIPEAISSISDFAFYNGSGFESISVYSTTSWGANTFYGCVTPTILGDVIGTCGEHLTWRLNGNTLYIEGYGDMENYANKTSMPWYPYRAQIQNVEFVDEATSVGNYAFNSLTNIQSVSFGSGIETIGSYSFTGCTGLTGTLTIGEGTTTINQNAFQGCTNITRVELNSGLTFLGYYAFYGCSNLEAITVPSSLETCNGYVFMSCNKLEAVYYEGSVDDWCGINFVSGSSSSPANNAIAKLYVDGNTETYLTEARITTSTIGNYAFYNNKELTSVIITSAGSVGTDAFHSCSNLARLEADPVTPPTTANNNVFWGVTKTIPFYIPAAGASAYADAARWSDFSDNRFLFGTCGENLSFVFAEATGTLTISGSGAMTAFGSAGAVPWSSFRSDITSINIESGVTTIGNYAFNNCSGLTSIALPEGITAIGNSAFYGCTSLASVTLPSTLTSIGSNAFINDALTSIIIPSSVTSIGSGAFKGNAALVSVGLAEAPQLTTIGNSAFENCSSLTSITIPNKVTSIGNSSFSGCSLLAAVNYGDTPTLATIGYSAFKNCSSLTSITIPESVTTITGNSSQNVYTPFAGCTSLTTVIWNARNCSGWTPINYGSSTYYQMPFESIKTQISSFTFGSNVQSIPQYLCHGMTGLESITIPASVTTIGANAFDGCTNIATVTSNATSIPSIVSSTFPSEVEDAATLYVPATVASRTAYSNDTYWSEFDHMLPYILSFNMKDHGDAIDPICVNAGRVNEALQPADPTEDYYTFDGWFSNEACTTQFTFGESGTVVSADMTLYAKWTINKYTVSFDSDGGSAVASITQDYNSSVAAPADPTKTGYSFAGWSPAVPSVMPGENTECVAQWTINQYTVSFDSDGGSAVASITQDYNSSVAAPADPTKTGYSFAGWSPAVPNTMPASNTECAAQWTINQYTVSFDSNGGSEVSSITQDYNSAVTAPANPTREGCTFAGWSPAVPNVMPGENTECVAQWTINQYTVSFDSDGGSAVASITQDYNSAITAPANPTREGYTFAGWSPAVPNVMPGDNIECVAQWTANEYTFSDQATTTDAIEAAEGKLALSITIQRTIWKDGYYNSMCLPFSLTAEQIAASPLADYKALKRLSSATVTGSGEDRMLNIQLEPITEITAGEPFFISYEVGENISSPEFENVTVTAKDPGSINKGDVTCHGIYAKTNLAANNTNLFLGANNALYWPAAGKNAINGLRAYFTINSGSSANAGMRVRLIDQPAEVPTGMESIEPSAGSEKKYIKDGVLFIERDGKIYNAQGALVQIKNEGVNE